MKGKRLYVYEVGVGNKEVSNRVAGDKSDFGGQEFYGWPRS